MSLSLEASRRVRSALTYTTRAGRPHVAADQHANLPGTMIFPETSTGNKLRNPSELTNRGLPSCLPIPLTLVSDFCVWLSAAQTCEVLHAKYETIIYMHQLSAQEKVEEELVYPES